MLRQVAAHRAAAYLYVATMVANVLAFGYQFVMARMLAPADYAILTALFGYLLLETISTQVIQSAAATLAARYRARGELAALHAFVRRWLARIALLAGLPALALVALSGPLGGALSLPPLTVALLGGTLFATAVLMFTQGLLQGLRHFGWLGSAQLVLASVRLALGVALVLAGTGVSGAFVGAATAPLVGVVLTLLALRPLLGAARGATATAELGSSETRFFLLTAVVLLAYAALTNLDAVLARPLLGPAEAGAYSGAITLGKVVLFAPIAVALILLERTARAHARDEDTHRPLALALGFVLATSGAVTVGYFVAPEFFTTLVVGTQYPGAVALVPRYGLAALSNAVLSIWIAHFVGRGAMRVGWLLVAGVAAEVGLLLVYARDASTTVTIVLGTALAMQVAAAATYGLERVRPRR